LLHDAEPAWPAAVWVDSSRTPYADYDDDWYDAFSESRDEHWYAGSDDDLWPDDDAFLFLPLLFSFLD
jgi:hypothetical protein